MSRRSANREYINRVGDPSHFVLLRFVWSLFATRWRCSTTRLESRDTSDLGQLIVNRVQARCNAYELLIDDLCEVCLENDWPIPAEIVIPIEIPYAWDCDGDDEEGQ